MKRAMIITLAATAAAVLWGIALRGEVAFGGELILPAAAIAYTLLTTEVEDEEKPWS